MPIYCGNNKNNKKLISGEADIGTRYECFKKGFGIGFNQPIDPEYLDDYEPIYQNNIYCGNKDDEIEINYKPGTLPQCLQKGVAIGKLKKAQENYDLGNSFIEDNEDDFILKITLILFLNIISTLIIIYFKPKFFLNLKTDNSFNCYKVILFLLLLSLLSSYLLFNLI